MNLATTRLLTETPPALCSALAVVVLGFCCGNVGAKSPPNLIIILADDLGYADVGFNGCQDIATPHIDRIAQEGVRFTNAYVTFPVCGPSRAGLMTGRYQDRFGFCNNPIIDPDNPKAGLPLSETTLAEALRPAGYRNMAIGKWHLGAHPTLNPLERGFDEFYGFLAGGHDYFPENLTLNDLSEVKKMFDWYRTKLLRNKERVETDEYLTDELSNEAVAFVERNPSTPFFLYLAYNAPHTPLQATDEYLERVGHIKNKRRKTYAAMVTAVDDGVGRLLDKLDTLNIADNTLVFFLSDNGGPTRKNASRNAPLRGGKGSHFEGGIRVPFAARWPAVFPSGADYESPVVSLDMFATITANTGAGGLQSLDLDGVDLVPFVTGKNTAPPHSELFWRTLHKKSYAVRVGDDKLIVDEKKSSMFLSDLGVDIGESTNLSADRPQVTDALHAKIEQWREGLQDPAFPPLNAWKKKPAKQSD